LETNFGLGSFTEVSPLNGVGGQAWQFERDRPIARITVILQVTVRGDLHCDCGIRNLLKNKFCAVTFPKSIIRSRNAFALVHTPIAHFFFRASIPCSHRQSTARNNVLVANQAALLGGGSFYLA
jgi:hypothetical protein